MTKLFVRDIGQRTTVGLTSRLERRRWNEQRRDEAAANQHHAHDHRGRRQQLLAVADAADGMLRRIVLIALDERHHGDASLEARKAERQLRKQQQHEGDGLHRAPVKRPDRFGPPAQSLGVAQEKPESRQDDDDVQREVDGDDRNGEADRLAEPFQEDRTERREQQQRQRHGVVQPVRRERILDDVRGGVRGRQGDRDDESSCSESEQAQDQRLAAPSRQEIFEERDAALTVWAELGDPSVHREGAEQRQQHEDERGERRQQPRCKEGNTRLVTQRREIVDAGEAHDLPPGRLMHLRLGISRLADALIKPPVKAATLCIGDE